MSLGFFLREGLREESIPGFYPEASGGGTGTFVVLSRNYEQTLALSPRSSSEVDQAVIPMAFDLSLEGGEEKSSCHKSLLHKDLRSTPESILLMLHKTCQGKNALAWLHDSPDSLIVQGFPGPKISV